MCECATGGLHAFMCLCFLMHPRNFEVHDACVCMYGGGGGYVCMSRCVCVCVCVCVQLGGGVACIYVPMFSDAP